MTYAMGTLYKNDKTIDNRLKILKNTTVVLAEAVFYDLLVLKPGINSQDENFDSLDQAFQNFLKQTYQHFYKTTMTFSNHYLAIKGPIEPLQHT